jgi:hypothetical protein
VSCGLPLVNQRANKINCIVVPIATSTPTGRTLTSSHPIGVRVRPHSNPICWNECRGQSSFAFFAVHEPVTTAGRAEQAAFRRRQQHPVMGKGGSIAPCPAVVRSCASRQPNCATSSTPFDKPAPSPLLASSPCPPHSYPPAPAAAAVSLDTAADAALRQHFRHAVLPELLQAVAARRMAPVPRRLPATFLLDWDDTCLCTSALESHGAMADFDAPTPPALAAALEVLEARVLTLLKTAHALGTVLIVTNAGDRWVELSAGRFMPSVRAFLDKHWRDVKVISARARYADRFPTAPLQWKARTFTDEIGVLHADAHLLDTPASIIVLGDSVGDQYAAHAALNEMLLRQRAAAAADADALVVAAAARAAGLSTVAMPPPPPSNLWLKVVKFLERPTVDQLSKELGVLLDHICAMTTHSASFDVSMYNEGEREPPASTLPVSSSSSSLPGGETGRTNHAADLQGRPPVIEHPETPMEVSC